MIEKISILEDLINGKTYELPKERTIIIGRESRKCDISVAINSVIATRVSGVHAAIRYDKLTKKYYLLDILSTFGTIIKNEREEKYLYGEKTELKNKTHILLGNVYPFIFYEKFIEKRK